jgi:hypothetical protein
MLEEGFRVFPLCTMKFISTLYRYKTCKSLTAASAEVVKRILTLLDELNHLPEGRGKGIWYCAAGGILHREWPRLYWIATNLRGSISYMARFLVRTTINFQVDTRNTICLSQD